MLVYRLVLPSLVEQDDYLVKKVYFNFVGGMCRDMLPSLRKGRY